MSDSSALSSTTNLQQAKLYFPQLDGVRSLAYLLVFSSHAGAIVPNPSMPVVGQALASFYLRVLTINWSGVDLFLVLSAFLITTILLREEATYGKIDLKLFYIRRTLRIWPVYFFASFFGLLFFPWLTYPSIAKMWTPVYWQTIATDAPWIFGFLLNIGIGTLKMSPPANLMPLWSISLEEQFYVFWGFFLKFCRNFKVRYFTLALLMVLTICARAYLQSMYDSHVPFCQNTLSRLDPLILGAAVAFFYHRKPELVQALTKFGTHIFAVFCGLFIVASMKVGSPFSKPNFDPFYMTFVDVTWTFLIISLLTFAPVIKVFSSKYIVEFGKLTYGMYVFHGAVLQVINRYLFHPINATDDWIFGPLINWLVGIPMTYLIAWLTWNTFEKKFYRLKFRFSQVPSGHG